MTRKLSYTLPNGRSRTIAYKNSYKYAIASTGENVSLAVVGFFTLGDAQKRADRYNKTKNWTTWQVITVKEA